MCPPVLQKIPHPLKSSLQCQGFHLSLEAEGEEEVKRSLQTPEQVFFSSHLVPLLQTCEVSEPALLVVPLQLSASFSLSLLLPESHHRTPSTTSVSPPSPRLSHGGQTHSGMRSQTFPSSLRSAHVSISSSLCFPQHSRSLVLRPWWCWAQPPHEGCASQ